METAPVLESEGDDLTGTDAIDTLLGSLCDPEDERSPEEMFDDFRELVRQDASNALVKAMKDQMQARPDLWPVLVPVLEGVWQKMISAGTPEKWQEAYGALPNLCRQAQERYSRTMKEAATDIEDFRRRQEHPCMARLKWMMLSPFAYLREVLGRSER